MGWVAVKGHRIEPFGLDFSPELIELARRRLPQWEERLFIGNAIDWDPPRRTYNEAKVSSEDPAKERVVEQLISGWGFKISGRSERPHFRDPAVVYRVVWIDNRL